MSRLSPGVLDESPYTGRATIAMTGRSYLRAMLRTGGTSLAIACVLASVASADPVRGRVVDSRGVPVRDAAIAIENTPLTATTDDAGWFSLDDVPTGAGVIVTKDGYAAALATVSAAPADVVLRPEGQGGETIAVHGEPPPDAPGALRASRAELQSMPGTGGDLMQALSAMPGVASTAIPLGATGVVIRGSSPQDSEDPGRRLRGAGALPRPRPALDGPRAGDRLARLPAGRLRRRVRPRDLRHRQPDHPRRRRQRAGRGRQLDRRRSAWLPRAAMATCATWSRSAARSSISCCRCVLPDDLDLSFVTVPRYYDEQLRIDYKLSSHWDVWLSSLGSDDALELYTDRVENLDQPLRRPHALRARHRRGALPRRAVDARGSRCRASRSEHDSELGAVQHLRVTSPAVTVRGELERRVDDAFGLARRARWRIGGEAVAHPLRRSTSPCRRTPRGRDRVGLRSERHLAALRPATSSPTTSRRGPSARRECRARVRSSPPACGSTTTAAAATSRSSRVASWRSALTPRADGAALGRRLLAAARVSDPSCSRASLHAERATQLIVGAIYAAASTACGSRPRCTHRPRST